MSVTPHTNGSGISDFEPQPKVVLELALPEAEALHTWLLRANSDGITSLDEPMVSAALATLSRAVDEVHVVLNIRRELAAVGLSGSHLTDDQVREFGRRIAKAVSAATGE